MRDTIYRDEAIEAVDRILNGKAYWEDILDIKDVLSALPSAEAEPTVIRSRTFMPTNDFKEWAERIRDVNPNAVVIPCDAEVVSAEALQAQPTHGRLIDADALEKELSKRWDISDDQDFCNKEVWDALRNAPTVQAKGGDADMNEVKSPYMQQSPNRATHGRLIDADALSKKLCATTIFIKDGEAFQRMINDAPTVKADRPHGEWLYRWNDVECSECGEFAKDKTNFCPNCGADMRGGK